MNLQPALFISHGAPMMVLEDSPARRFLAGWSARFGRPQAILVVSAHWENRGGPAVSVATQPGTIHDFMGFPPALHEIEYASPGAPEVAEQAINLLRSAGYTVESVASRGLDHGAWAPLSLMYPNADIPVFQVSLLHGGDGREHYRLGRALQSLRMQGVLIIGSGSLTHNLYEFMGHARDDQAPPWVVDFENWIEQALITGRHEDLMNYRALAPHAQQNHPTDEHLLPLFVALGAAGEQAAAARIHASHTYGVLSMDAYLFAADATRTGASAVLLENAND
ncbi:MAG: DODA-type extradiol aromatic ring-opening family dioxygenase [Sulfuriferula sp.]